MITADAPFHELKGIGPATETKLHEAGIRTWAALAEVLDAIARVREIDASRLRDLRDQARGRVDEPPPARAPDGEQTSRFVVTAVSGPNGDVTRTNITDVRSEAAKSFSGLAGEDIAAFIARHVQERATNAEQTRTDRDFAEAEPDMPIRFVADGTGDVVVLDVGKSIGGGDRRIELRWDTSDIEAGDEGDFRYRATLAGRPYGEPTELSWQAIGSLTGMANPGEIVDLRFDTSLPAGIHRLQLTVEVQASQLVSAGNPRRVEVAAVPAS